MMGFPNTQIIKISRLFRAGISGFYRRNYFWDSGAATARSRVYRPWGNDPTAACGGGREGSEWQRSTDAKAHCVRRQMSGTATGGAKRLESATCLSRLPHCHGRPKENGFCVKQKPFLRNSGITCRTLQQQQPRKRSYRPWGCYLRPQPTRSHAKAGFLTG